MFLINEFTPKNIDDVFFHKELIEKLHVMSKDESIPHMVFYGPEGVGKKTTIKLFLEMLYGKNVNNIEECVYKVVGSGNKVTEVIVKQSDYHIIIEPNNNNFDRYLIQDIVKEYAKRMPLTVIKTSKVFKTVLINSIDNLSYYAQTSLRRTMEKYSGTCRFIMWCRSLSKVIEPLRSRCLCFRIESPSSSELFRYIYKISSTEHVKLDLEDYTRILNNANGNIKIALWQIQVCKEGLVDNNMYINTIKTITNLITTCDIDNIVRIKTHIYNITITNIFGTKIIKDVMIELCKNPNIPNLSKFKIIETTAKYEHNLIRGRREIVHLLGFIITVIRILKESNYVENNIANEIVQIDEIDEIIL
jgi:replication factor C subunit 3/5